MDSSLAGRLARGVFWSFLGAGISRGLALLSSVFAARLLGAEGYGLLGMVRSAETMFAAFAGFGLGTTATRYVAELRERDPSRVGRILGLSRCVALATGSLMGMLLLVLAPTLARDSMAAPQLAPHLRVAALMLVFGALNGAETGALVGFEAFGTVARTSLLSGLAHFPLMAIGVWRWGVTGGVWALTIGMGLHLFLNRAACEREARRLGIAVRWRRCWEEADVLWGFALPNAIACLFSGPALWAANTMLARSSFGYFEVGILTAASQWRSLASFIPGVIANANLSLLSNHNSRDQLGDFRSVLTTNSVAVLAVAFLQILLVALLLPVVLRAYGPDYGTGSAVFLTMTAVGSISVFSALFFDVVRTKGRPWHVVLVNGVWSVAVLSMSRALLPHGAKGISAAIAGAYALHLLMTVSLARHAMRKERGDGVPGELVESRGR